MTEKLLPAMPPGYRVVAALAAGAGLRWGECLGLRWGSVDFDAATLTVSRVVVEVAGRVSSRPFPKTSASRRVIPLAPFLSAELKSVLAGLTPDPTASVVVGPDGGSLRRGNFRRRIWIPSLLRAGLIAGMRVESPTADGGHRLCWTDQTGKRQFRTFRTRAALFAHAARATPDDALHFHDLRHCYATWLVSRGVPVNVVQKVLGHQQASTTLNRYTHTPGDFLQQIR
ncbi:MAG: site-specific integrase, partial [Sciscionella sp.]